METEKDGQTGPETGRRSVLGWIIGVGAAAVAGVLSVPVIRFALHPITSASTTTEWSDLGTVEELSGITAPKKVVITVSQVDGWRKVVLEKSVYVIKKPDGKLGVLSAICPHLGCSIKSSDTADHKFLCPCHKGVFNPDGKLASGPPPRGMDELETREAEGKLQVKYQSFRQLVPTKEVIA